MKNLLFILLFLLSYTMQAQFNNCILTSDSNTTFPSIQGNLNSYIDSLVDNGDSSMVYSGDGDGRKLLRFTEIWESRLYPNKNFHSYNIAEAEYYSSTSSQFSTSNTNSWKEIGPLRSDKGIGPAEFLRIYDDGSATSTKFMLSGSLPGGLFLSSDYGETWNNAGSDNWEQSGCSWASFYPTNHEIICASTSGNGGSGHPVWIRRTGGIYYTINSGASWTKIADYNDIGEWTIIYQVHFLNNNTLVAVTSNGFYLSSNYSTSTPTWTKVLSGNFFDFEISHSSNSKCFLSEYDLSSKIGTIWESNDFGQTWNAIDQSPNYYPTIEVSKSKPHRLYVCLLNKDDNFKYDVKFYENSTWTNIPQIYNAEKMYFGDGHSFAIDHFNNGDNILISHNTRLRKLSTIYPNSTINLITPNHVDVEYITYHPYNNGEVWICSHGGVEKSIDGGDTWTPKYEGYGSAMTTKMNNSKFNNQHLMLGLYHDGTVLTRSDYNTNWNPDWETVRWGDGEQPLIDDFSPNHMWASSQYGNWWYSDDYFQPGSLNYFKSKSRFASNAVLNKTNSNILYSNKNVSNQIVVEEVCRFDSRGTTDGTIISNFDSQITYPANRSENIILGLKTPYQDDNNTLLIWLIARNENNESKFYAFITHNATSANPVWSELQLPRDGWVSDLEFDRENNNIIYLVYGSSENMDNWPLAKNFVYKIDYANISSPVFTDISKNLPYTYTSYYCMASDCDLSGSLYLATDFGVFATNQSELQTQDSWEKLGVGLPNVRIKGIEIVDDENLLRVGTVGRGAWELPIGCYNDISTVNINNNTVWDRDTKLTKSVVIGSNSTLTIANARIMLSSEASIIVNPGSNLIVDNSILSNCCYNQHWQGIQVRGSSSSSQNTLPSPQGQLTLLNGAIIENANIAIDMWEPNNASTAGAIVQADGATFRNNTISVRAPEYRNYQAGHPSIELPNRSYFRDCSFEITDGYHANNEFENHVYMWGNNGIDFEGCSFTLDPNATDISPKNYGIRSLNCEYSVLPIDLGGWNNYDKTNFNNFYCGILASSDGSTTRTIEARHCVFNNNANGIILEQVNNATVLYNDFHIGANETDAVGCTTASGLGLFIDNATGFAVEGNSFDKASGAPLGNYMGIRLLYPIGTTNVIAHNNFEGLSYGVHSQGVKFQMQTWQGLSLLCNDNVDNYADFYGIDGGLQINQGTPSLPAGNTFSQDQGTTWHFYSGEDQLVYYYCTSCTNEEPDNYKIEHITKNGLSNSNLCVSAYYGDDNSGKDKMSVLTEDEQQMAAQEYTSSAQEYDNVKVLYDNLKDGGDTDAELMDVQTAQSGDTWTLRSQLLGHSPHLSMKVLKETAGRTDIFSDSHLFDILSANPDELKKGELISYLENKEEPLPGYMVSILKQLAEGGTYKTVLEEQLSSHTRGKNRHATAMLRSILHDSIRDYNQMRLWLDKLGGIDADRQIVASYVQQGDFSSAQGLSAMIPSLYGLEGRELEEHGYYEEILDLHQNLSQQGRSIFQLDTTELQLLRFIADTSKGVAATQARAILRNVAGDDFYNCPCINGNAAFKDNAVWPEQSLNTALKVSVSPVPAHDWVNFEYSLPSGLLNAELSVYQPGGKLLKNMELNGQQGQYTLDLRNMETGLYFYSLKSGSYIKSGKFLLSR